MATKKEIAREVLNILFDNEAKSEDEDAVEMRDCIAVVMTKLMNVEEYLEWLNDRHKYLYMGGVVADINDEPEKQKPHLTLVE